MLVSKDCHPGFQKQPALFAITQILPWFPQELSYHFSQNNLCTLLPLPSKPERLTFSHEALKWGKRLHVTQPMRSTIGPCGHSFPEDYNLTQGKVTSGDEVGMLTEGREVLCLVAGLLLSSQRVLLRGNTNPITADVYVSVLS